MYQNIFSCAPAWDDANSSSYVVYILLLGFIIPNLIITYTSIAVLQYHKKVSSNQFGGFSLKSSNYFKEKI